MKTLSGMAFASVLALGLVGAAQAQTIPNPTNPTPRFPIATDGTPLPYHGAYDGGLVTGRSAYAPVATQYNAVVGTGFDAAETGLGIAGSAVGAGLGTAGAVVDGTTGALGVR